VRFDVSHASLEVAEAFGQIDDDQTFDKTLGIFVEMSGKLQLLVEDLVVGLHSAAAAEGVASGDHLVGHQAQAPPVDSPAVSPVEQYLWRHLLWRATHRVCPSVDLLGLGEVRQLQLPVCVDQHVFGLQVSLNDVLCVHLLECEDQVCALVAGMIGIELALDFQLIEELSAGDLVHH
jgi:hypothetical protein